MAGFLENIKKSTSLVFSAANSKLESVIEKSKSVKNEKYFLPRKSIIVDYDEGLGFNGLYKEKGSLISYDVLRQIAEKDVIIQAIISKLCNRVAAFAQPQKNKYSLGFIVKPNPHLVTDHISEPGKELDETDMTNVPGQDKLTSTQKQEINKVVSFIMKCGMDSENRPMDDRKSFETFLRMIIRDRLIYNQIGIECIPTTDNQSIAYFLPVNGGSIRFASYNMSKQSTVEEILLNRDIFGGDPELMEERQERTLETSPKDIKYVQIYRGQIYAVFTDKDLIYRQGTPSTEIMYNGYAPGEMELMLNTIANHRIAESHNESFFRFGYANNGILNIKTELIAEDLEAIKRQFQRQYQGVRNAFKMPIMAAKDGIEWVQMGPSNKDMEWSSWIEYLIKIMCSCFGLNPAEINFDISRTHGHSLGDGGNRNEVQLRDTRNSMLRPLLRWVESIVNDDLLPKFDTELSKKYIFEFVGIEHEDKDAELNRIEKQVKNYRTINEIRIEEGLEAIEYGNIILNNDYLNYFQNATGMNNSTNGSGSSSSSDSKNSNFGSEDEMDDPSVVDNQDKNSVSDEVDELARSIDEKIIGNLLKEPDKENASKILKSLIKNTSKKEPTLLKVEYFKNE